MARNISIQEALQLFHELPSDESEGESGSEWEDEEESNSSDTEEDEEEGEDTSSRSEQSADGLRWIRQTPHSELQSGGRVRAENLIRKQPGPTGYAKRSVTEDSCKSAFSLFVNESMLRLIKKYTDFHANTIGGQTGWSVTLEELEKCIGILYLKGALLHKNTPLDSLWSKQLGSPKVQSVMPRNRFREIIRHMRFDKKDTRSQRLKKDRFALASELWNPFNENCVACYNPHENITIDEQLYPCKARCSFTQYIATKPDKFGLKFWLAADVESKYMLHGFPYTGRDEARPATVQFGEHIVLKLVAPFERDGINITTDNFFTSFSLARSLLRKHLTIVGTLKANRREIPTGLKEMKEKGTPVHETVIMQEKETGVTITGYKPKKSKCVLILSSLHKGDISISTAPKRKPETVVYYNQNKCGVDVLDQMARFYTVKFGSRRWPMHVLFNILDLAGVNAWIIYKSVTQSNLSRRDFLIRLAEELMGGIPGHGQSESADEEWQESTSQVPRRRCQVKVSCPGNLTSSDCHKCKRRVCGKCTEKQWKKFVCKNCC